MLADGSLHTSPRRVVIRMIRHSDKMIRIPRSAHHPMIHYPGLFMCWHLIFHLHIFSLPIGSIDHKPWLAQNSRESYHNVTVMSPQLKSLLSSWTISSLSAIKRHIWEMRSKWNISLVWLGITSKLIIQWGAILSQCHELISEPSWGPSTILVLPVNNSPGVLGLKA